MTPPSGQLWIELAPLSASAPARLIVFLHGAASSPEYLVPLALAWQLRFPGATVVLLEGIRPAGDARLWFDPLDRDPRGAPRIDTAVAAVATRVRGLQGVLGLGRQQTVLVGVGQGATVALEAARAHPLLAAIVVGHAARLASPIREGERIPATVHLVHGAFDSVVPLVHAQRACRGLRAVGTDVTLDVLEGESHTLSQGLVNVGTLRVLQTAFRGRNRRGRPTLH